MKKSLALLFVLSMICCFASAEDTDVTGTWRLISAELNGTVYDSAVLDAEIIMTLNADGTMSLVFTGVGDFVGAWSQNGASVIVTNNKDKSFTFTLVNGALRLEYALEGEEFILLFAREASAAPVYSPAPTHTDAAPEELLGEWHLIMFEAFDQTIDPTTLGMECIMTLNADGTMIMRVVGGGQSPGTWTTDGHSVIIDNEGETLTCAYRDGELRGAYVIGGLQAVMVFRREKSDAQPFAPAPIRLNVSLDNVLGVWNSRYAVATDQPISPGLGITLTVEKDKVTMESDIGFLLMPGILSQTMLYKNGEATADGVFELIAVVPEGTMKSTDAGICLHEDGMLSLTTHWGNSYYTMFFTRQTE